MKKILALALALILAVSCLAINTFAADDVTVDLLINPTNIINATIAKGVATFDGTTAGYIKLPVPLLGGEVVTVHVEGESKNGVIRAFASNGGGGGMHDGNVFNANNSENLALNAPYSVDMPIGADANGGATHVCIKSVLSSNTGNAPAGMTITKLSVTYSSANIDEQRQEALNAVIEAQVSTAFSFYYNGKYYGGDIVTAYTGAESQVGSNATIKSYPATIESDYEIVAAASGRYIELKDINAYLRVTVSAGTVSKAEIVEGGGPTIGADLPAFVIANEASGTTDYYFKGTSLTVPNGGNTNKQIRVYGENATVEAVAAVTVVGPVIEEYTVAAPTAGDKLYDIKAVSVNDGGSVKLHWYEGEVELLEADGPVAEAGKTYTAKIIASSTAILAEDIIVIVNGNEAEVYQNGDETELRYEESFTVIAEEFDGITVSLHTPEVGKALAKEAEVTNAVNYTAEYIQMCYDLVNDPESDFDIADVEDLEAVLGDTVLWMNSEGGEIFNGHVVTEEDTYFEVGVVLLIDEMEEEEAMNLKVNFNESRAIISSILEREIAEQLGFEIPEGKMLAMAIYEYEAPFGEDEYFKPETDEKDPMDSRKTGWFCTGETYHAMIIGRAIISLPHEFNAEGTCIYCRYHADTVVE